VNIETRQVPESALTDLELIAAEEDAITLLKEMIAIPSVNHGEGRGDERAMAEYVSAKLGEVGIESEQISSAPNRVSVVAKVAGSNTERPGLVVHGHIDVVPANAADWSVDPFSGIEKDGYIWGRGAVDMKDGCAQYLALIRAFARKGYRPPRNLLLVFFADEEASGSFGSRWLVKNRPELFSGYNEAISEVGGFSVTISSGHRLYWIQTAEKGLAWLKLTAKGTAGHGSFVNRDNAISKLAAAINRIAGYEHPILETKTGKIFWSKVAELTGNEYRPEDPRELLPHIGASARMMGATISNSSNPTMLEAGYKANVIPQSASVVVDSRFLPGQEEELLKTIQFLAGEDVEIEVLAKDKALEFDFQGDLAQAMQAAILSEDPDAICVPYVMSGGTDNKALAELNITGYGFTPLKLPAELDFFALFHGIDERVPVEGLRFGVRALARLLHNC
jgi:acetylornithine deacetylase/succinyl-diaminopimelate desuccinylase-like protein